MQWISLKWLRVQLFITKSLYFLRIQIQQERILTIQRQWLEVERMERSIRDVMVMKMVKMVKMAKGKKEATMVQQVKKMKMQAGGLEFKFSGMLWGCVVLYYDLYYFIVTCNDFRVFDFRYIDVSENSGTPITSIWIGFSIINLSILGYRIPLFLETPIWMNTHDVDLLHIT